MANCTCCKNCEKRHIGSHDTCEDYIAFRSERDVQLAEDYKRRTQESIIVNHQVRTVIKHKKGRLR